MVLLITGTVNPDSSVTSLAVKDCSERLRQYKDTIEWAIDTIHVGKIVFCDNSLYPREYFEPYTKTAECNGKKFEYLTFVGNKEKIISQGKGYGEGEIIEFVLKNSTLLNDEEYFIKLTGRLKVENLNSILPSMKKIMRINMFNPERVDTRLYGIPIEAYKRYFIHSYYKVDDRKGYYLEHSFTDAMIEAKIKSRNLSRFPRYVGISGSTGRVYLNNKFKCKLKDLLSIINYFGFRKGKK